MYLEAPYIDEYPSKNTWGTLHLHIKSGRGKMLGADEVTPVIS
jgi:hypothetical protein